MAYNLLKGKKGIIFGALNEQSIAWKVAQRAVEEGAEIVLSNAPIALRMGELNKLAEQCNAPVIGADVTNNDDIVNLFTKTQEHFGGGVDFILHSIGMSVNVRKGITYTQNNYDFSHKGLDISSLSLHRILQTAMKMDAINEWGSVLALTYIAAQRVFPDYNDMADNKAIWKALPVVLATIMAYKKRCASIPYHNRLPALRQDRVLKVSTALLIMPRR